MVTLVPPDSGPRLGDRPVTVGIYKQMQRQREVRGDAQIQEIFSGIIFVVRLEAFMYYH